MRQTLGDADSGEVMVQLLSRKLQAAEEKIRFITPMSSLTFQRRKDSEISALVKLTLATNDAPMGTLTPLPTIKPTIIKVTNSDLVPNKPSA